MNKEEFKECSVVAYPRQIKFLHINGGAISYYVDRHVSDYVDRLQQENKQLKDKLSKIETLIINHNCDTGDIYYKYNSRFLKSELKQRILEIVYEEESDSDE